MIADKTKAALQSCQGHYGIFKQSQHTRVNAGGQRMSQLNIEPADFTQLLWQSVKLRFMPKLLIVPSLLTLRTVSRCEENRISLLMNFSQRWQINRVVTNPFHSFLELVGSFPSKSSKWQVQNAGPIHPNYLPSSRCSRKPYRIIAIHVLGKDLGRISFLHHKFRMCNKNALSHLCASSFSPNQPFGSIPCRRNSVRANSFIQLPRLTPSRSAASFSCWRNSGLILIWKVGDQPSPLGVLSRLIVDTYVHNLITWSLLCTYVNTSGIEKTTPQTVGAVLGRLTKPLTGVTIMAEQQHTQTHPKFTWRFISTSERYPAAKPLVIYINASSEQKARSTMPGVNLILAARLPFHALQVTGGRV